MAVTVLHQLGAAIWVGGVIHLGVLWPLARRQPESLWPHCLVRFSPLAILAVTTLVAAGCYLSWYYIGSWDGLIGTSYGVMVLTKIALLGVGLSLGGMNFLAGRRWLRYGDSTGVQRRTPPFVEVETGIGCILLLVAASLTSLPPAVDVPAEQRASGREVAAQFAPQFPRLSPPPLQELLAVAPSVLDTYVTHQPIEYAQSEYNHHMAGLLVLAMGLLALLERGWGLRWARHWPLLFFGLGGFLFIQAEPTVWPLGPEGFWETLFDPSVLQHRLATLLVFGLGWFEWRVQTGKFADTRRPYVFPVLCLIGGVVLLTHSHTALGFKAEFLIEVSHALLGFLAVLVGCGRWLELRLPPPANRLPGLLWTTAFLLTGVVLVFYRET
jgi:putative copper resistance protein D